MNTWVNPFEKYRSSLVKPSTGHWARFKRGKYCTLSEAILLSIDIEPDWYLDLEAEWNKEAFGAFRALKYADYADRLITAKSLGKANALWVMNPDESLGEQSTVDLVGFAKALITAGYDVPEEFIVLVGDISLTNQIKSISEEVASSKKLQPWTVIALDVLQTKLDALGDKGVTSWDVLYGEIHSWLDRESKKDGSIKAVSADAIRQHPEIKELKKKYLNK